MMSICCDTYSDQPEQNFNLSVKSQEQSRDVEQLFFFSGCDIRGHVTSSMIIGNGAFELDEAGDGILPERKLFRSLNNQWKEPVRFYISPYELHTV